jgi:hypothetical protein
MMQSWSVERMAEQHRQDLSTLSPVGRGARARANKPGPVLSAVPAQPVRTAQLAAAGTRPVRRPLGQHVGTLLIRAGTRLGGASMRTS